MDQETLVRPERYVKVCMALVTLSLVIIAVCQVILVLRPPPQPMMRRPMPMADRMIQQGQTPMPPGMMPMRIQQGQGMPEGTMQRPPPPPGQGQGEPTKK